MNTPEWGANKERTAILAKIRKMMKAGGDYTPTEILMQLESWILSRNERYNKRKGGLGK